MGEGEAGGVRPGPARTGRRDRRGRGRRGPDVVPRVPGEPERPTGAERFDAAVLDVAAELDARWGERLPHLEYAVEDVPGLVGTTSRDGPSPPSSWAGNGDHAVVPLSSLVPGGRGRPARIVLFRRPVEHRCLDRAEMEAVVHALVVEHVADLLGLDAAEVDPRYRDPGDLGA